MIFFLFLRAKLLSNRINVGSLFKKFEKLDQKDEPDIFVSINIPPTPNCCAKLAKIDDIMVFKRHATKQKENPSNYQFPEFDIIFHNTEKHQILNNRTTSFIFGDLRNDEQFFYYLLENNFNPHLAFDENILQRPLEDNENQLIFAESSDNIPKEFVFERNFTEFQQSKVYIYGPKYQNICSPRMYITPRIAEFLLIMFIFAIIIGIPARKSVGKFENQNNGSLWFVTSNGKTLTKSPKLTEPQKQILQNLISKVNYSKSQESEIYDHNYTILETSLMRFNVFPVTKHIYMVLMWTELMTEDRIPPAHEISGSYLRIDDVEDPIPVPLHVKPTKDSKKIKVNVPFTIDNEECELVITPYGDKLPFGLYSLHETYTDFLHSNIFKLGMGLDKGRDAFIDYLEHIFYSLDYTSLIAFTQIGENDLQPIAQFATSDEIMQISEKWARDMYRVKKRSASLIKETINNLRVCMSTFRINDHDYVICVSFSAGTLIMRSSEAKLHFIIAMFIAFNHNILEKREDIIALPRIYDLIEKCGRMSLIECTGSPTNIRNVRGTLFGKPPTEQLLKQILTPTVWSNGDRYDTDYEQMKQYQFPFISGKEVKVLSVTSIKYYDDSLTKDVYQYLLEDVTYLHNRVNKLDFTKSIPTVLLSCLAGFHPIASNFRVCDQRRLSLELGYEQQTVESLNQVMSNPDIQDLKQVLASKESCQKVVTLICADNRPKRFVVVSLPSQPIFYLFPLPDVTPLYMTDDEQLVKWNGPNDYNIFVYNSSQEVIYDSMNESMLLEEFAETRIFEPDRQKFIDYLNKPAMGGDITQVVIRVFTGSSFSWRIMKTTPHEKHPEIILVHFWTIADSSLELSLEYDFADVSGIAFGSAKVIHWIFENSREPVRIFRSMPRGVNTLIFNWTTIENNIHSEFREFISNDINRCITHREPINLIVPIYFEELHWFLLRGDTNPEKKHLAGIAFDISNLSTPKRSIRTDNDSIPDLDRFAMALSRAKEYVSDKETRKLLTIAELAL